MRIRQPLTGEVIEWRPEGYGFVMAQHALLDGQPIFVHASQLQNGQPRVGDAMRLDGAHYGTRGWRAEGRAEVLEH